MSDKRAVFKYPLPLTNDPDQKAKLELPRGAMILKVAEQPGPRDDNGTFFVWAVVDPEEEEIETRNVVTVGTGHPFSVETLAAAELSSAYRGTILALGGAFVLHAWISGPVLSRTKEES